MDRWATFDCYGTLIDWNGGIGRELERLFGPNEAGEKLRLYHELEPEIQREDPTRSYREVMAIALARLGAPAEEHDALAASLPGWDPFPEVPAALEEARSRGWRLAILSNSDRDLIDASLARLGVPFDETIVASEIGSYKPAPRTGRSSSPVPAQTGPGTSMSPRACFTTSRLRRCWVCGLCGSTDSARRPEPEPDIELENLGGLAEALDVLVP